MFKGSVYCRRWTYDGKKRKAWGIRYSVNAGPITRQVVADTKEGAQAELDKKREDCQRRTLGVSDGKTFADLTPVFLAHKENQERDMQPIRARLASLLPYFGGLALEEIGAETIDGYIQERKAAGVENGTINRDLSVLHHMLRLAVRKWRWLRQEPYVEALPENGARELELTEEEETRLQALASPPLWALVQAAIFTGMRQGELLKLTWPQVDLANRVIDFAPTKHGRKRDMPVAEPLYYILARLKAAHAARNGDATTDRVFVSPTGRPWTKWMIESHFDKALIAAQITTPLRFHDLRHTCASRLKRLGAHEMDIQQLLGHKRLQTTRGYINIRTDDLRRAVNLLSSTREAQELTPENVGPSNLS